MLAQGVAGRPYVPPQSMARHRADAERMAAAPGHLDLSGTTLTVAANAEIYGEEEPAQFLYEVVSGAVRTSKLLSDGRRQVCSFYLPGDIFGLDAGELHRFSAEAVTTSVVRVLDRRRVTAAAEREGGLRSQLLSLTAHELCHAHDHVLLLGRKSATERVVAFLLEMAARQPRRPAVDLPMSRSDIADYLGLTVETVSRTLSELESSGAIRRTTSRSIVLRDQARLRRLDA